MNWRRCIKGRLGGSGGRERGDAPTQLDSRYISCSKSRRDYLANPTQSVEGVNEKKLHCRPTKRIRSVALQCMSTPRADVSHSTTPNGANEPPPPALPPYRPRQRNNTHPSTHTFPGSAGSRTRLLRQINKQTKIDTQNRAKPTP